MLCLSLVVLTVLFSGCQSNRGGKYRVYTTGVSDYSALNVQKEEYSINYEKMSVNILARKKASTTFMDVKYVGSYKYTMSSDLCPHNVNFYHTEDLSMFGLDTRTGELRFLIVSSKSDQGTAEGKNLSEEECVALAETFLSTQIDDMSEYVLIKTSTDPLDDGVKAYSFYYARQINGIMTKDTISVGFRSTGTLVFYDARTYGTLKGAKLPSSYDEEEVTNAIREKMDELCASLDEGTKVEYTEKSCEVIRLRNGSVGLLVSLDLSVLRTGDENARPYSEAVQLIIDLG